jgi:hypothetical protein
MSKRFRIWFSDRNEEGVREFRYYFTSDFDSAVISLKVAINELELVKEIYPNMFGLSEWCEEENDWLEWGWESDQDIREYIYKINLSEEKL